MEKYKYAHPYDWLEANIGKLSTARILNALAHLQGDEIQELFQEDMDADGYFTPHDVCAVCDDDELIPVSQLAKCSICGKLCCERHIALVYSEDDDGKGIIWSAICNDCDQ